MIRRLAPEHSGPIQWVRLDVRTEHCWGIQHWVCWTFTLCSGGCSHWPKVTKCEWFSTAVAEHSHCVQEGIHTGQQWVNVNRSVLGPLNASVCFSRIQRSFSVSRDMETVNRILNITVKPPLTNSVGVSKPEILYWIIQLMFTDGDSEYSDLPSLTFQCLE